MRSLCIDLGQRRVGVAVSDPTGTIARPLIVLQRKERQPLLEAIAAIARREGAARVIVGLPLSLSGDAGPQARSTMRFVEELRATIGDIPVDVWDERYSTTQAQESLQQRGVRGKAQRASVDMIAAATILQSYLDHQNRRLDSAEAAP